MSERLERGRRVLLQPRRGGARGRARVTPGAGVKGRPRGAHARVQGPARVRAREGAGRGHEEAGRRPGAVQAAGGGEQGRSSQGRGLQSLGLTLIEVALRLQQQLHRGRLDLE